MAFAVTRPIAAQIMVAVSGIERLIGRQGHENRFQFAIEHGPLLPLGLTFVIAFEG